MRRAAQGLSNQLMDQAPPALLSAHDLLPSAGRTLPRPAAGRSLAEVTRTKALSPTFKTHCASNFSWPKAGPIDQRGALLYPHCCHADLGERAPWPCTVTRWLLQA